MSAPPAPSPRAPAPRAPAPFHAGRLLRQAREAKGLTQADLAAALGLSGRQALSRIESRQATFRLPFAQAAAQHLGLPAGYFLAGDASAPEAPRPAGAAPGPPFSPGDPVQGDHVMLGDAMEPEIADGERVSVEYYDRPLATVPADGVYLVAVEGRRQVLRVQALRGSRLRLVPTNPAYAETVVDVAAEPGVVAVLGRVQARDRLASALIRQFFAFGGNVHIGGSARASVGSERRMAEEPA